MELQTALRDSPVNHLELAAEYGSAGFWEEAVQVLARPLDQGLKAVNGHPLVRYFLGYYLSRKGEGAKASESARQAAALSPDYVFPWQSECLEVFRWARTVNPNDGRALLYLGNFLFDLQPEEALKAWEGAVASGPADAVAYRNLGLAYARVKNDVGRAVSELEKAVALAPADPKLFFELDQYYEAARAPLEKRLSLLEKNHAAVEKRDDALAREVLLLVQAGRYDRAIELLGSRHFRVWEGGGEIYGVFVEAHLLRGRNRLGAGEARAALADFETALTYPRNLDVIAPPSGGGSAKVYYWIGRAHEALRNPAKAKDTFEKAASFRHGWSEPVFYQGLAQRKLGREFEARKIFEGLVGFARERIDTSPAMDFFEKFGERQSAAKQAAEMRFLAGLGLRGLGREAEADAEFRKALALDPNHLGAARALDGTAVR